MFAKTQVQQHVRFVPPLVEQYVNYEGSC